MITPFQVGRVKIEPRLNRSVVDLSIIHEKLGQPATLTIREVQMLADELVNVLEKAEQEKASLKRQKVKA